LRVLVVNAGSSSLKLRLLDAHDEVLAAEDLRTHQGRVDAEEVARAVSGMPAPDAVGHRVVHGGERFAGPVVIDPDVEAALRDLTDLAPLHQPKSLAALDAVGSLLPETPTVACFDTAFHATLPPAAATYAVPERWRTRLGVRRYGFHGLSHAYASRRAAEMLGREDLRLVSCHLGAGASLAAVRDGQSIDTTMGFTPLDGLVMATRSGSIDPGLLLWLIEHESMSAGELAEALEHSSGLLALAGSADMREVLARAEQGQAEARLALDVYIHRLRSLIGAMAASLGGLDALLFTGGVGESSAQVRALATEGVGFLGVQLDPDRNKAATGDVEVSGRGDGVSVLVVQAREDVEIAKQVRALLGAAQARPGPRRS
jgi:acetate kinase